MYLIDTSTPAGPERSLFDRRRGVDRQNESGRIIAHSRTAAQSTKTAQLA